jgi:hypothetical protein
MAKLSDSEQALLDKLNKKVEAPDAPSVGKSISATIDLGNADQVALAIKHGFLTADEVKEIKEGEEEGESGDKKVASKPRRPGYFKDKGDE